MRNDSKKEENRVRGGDGVEWGGFPGRDIGFQVKKIGFCNGSELNVL